MNRKYTLLIITVIMLVIILSIFSTNKATNEFSLRDTFIRNTPVLMQELNSIENVFGEPLNTKCYDVYSSADINPQKLKTLEYPSITLEIFPDSADYVFRYDITGDNYSFKDITIGMTQLKFKQMYPNIPVYSLNDNSIDFRITKLLNSLKPEGYYQLYSHAAYMDGSVGENELVNYGSAPYSLGAVILFDNAQVGRIVFGYPTAG